ncbi:hypothetical protein GCM10009714_16490 [Microlunatus capsulatus]
MQAHTGEQRQQQDQGGDEREQQEGLAVDAVTEVARIHRWTPVVGAVGSAAPGRGLGRVIETPSFRSRTEPVSPAAPTFGPPPGNRLGRGCAVPVKAPRTTGRRG